MVDYSNASHMTVKKQEQPPWNKPRKRSKARIKISAQAGLIVALMILKVLIPSVMATFGGNHCDVEGEDWILPDDGLACLAFSDGSNGYQSSALETCGEGEEVHVEYAYRKINKASLRTFLVITDMRNAVYSDNDAQLFVAFRWSLPVSDQYEGYEWIALSEHYHTQLYNWVDDVDNPYYQKGARNGEYMLLKYSCPHLTGCQKIQIVQIACYSEMVVQRSRFEGYDSSDSNTSLLDNLTTMDGNYLSTSCQGSSTCHQGNSYTMKNVDVDETEIGNIEALLIIQGFDETRSIDEKPIEQICYWKNDIQDWVSCQDENESNSNKIQTCLFDTDKIQYHQNMDVLIFDDQDDQPLVAGFILLQGIADICENNCEDEKCFSIKHNVVNHSVDKVTNIQQFEFNLVLTTEVEACKDKYTVTTFQQSGSLDGVDLVPTNLIKVGSEEITMTSATSQLENTFQITFNGQSLVNEFSYKFVIYADNNSTHIYTSSFSRLFSDCSSATFQPYDDADGPYMIYINAGDQSEQSTKYRSIIPDSTNSHVCQDFRTHSILNIDSISPISAADFPPLQLLEENNFKVSYQMNPEWTEKTQINFMASATLDNNESIIVPVQINVVICEADSVSNSYSYQVIGSAQEDDSLSLLNDQNEDEYISIQIGLSSFFTLSQPTITYNIRCEELVRETKVITLDMDGNLIDIPGFSNNTESFLEDISDDEETQLFRIHPQNPLDNVYLQDPLLDSESYTFKVMYIEEIKDYHETHTYYFNCTVIFKYVDKCFTDAVIQNIPVFYDMETSVLRLQSESTQAQVVYDFEQTIADPITVTVLDKSSPNICGEILVEFKHSEDKGAWTLDEDSGLTSFAWLAWDVNEEIDCPSQISSHKCGINDISCGCQYSWRADDKSGVPLEQRIDGNCRCKNGENPSLLSYKYTYQSEDENERKFYISPISNSEIGTGNFILRYYLELYPQVEELQNFEIRVLPCEIKSAQQVQIIQDQLYQVLNPPIVLQYTKLFDFEPSCYYQAKYKYQASTVPAFNSLDQEIFELPDDNLPEYTLYTDDLSAARSYQVTFTLTIEDYTYDGGIFSTSSFNVLLSDPCSETTLQASIEIVHLHAIVGIGDLNYQFIQFKDTASKTWDTVNNGYITCGPRLQQLFEIDEANPQKDAIEIGQNFQDDYVKVEEIDDYEVQLTYGTNDVNERGNHYIQFRSFLQNYSNIQDSTAILNVTFYELMTDLTMQTKYEYSILQEDDLKIDVPLIIFSPQLHQSYNENTGQNGANVLYKAWILIESEWEELQQELGYLTSANQILIINPSEDKYVGQHQIKITFTMQDYLDGQELETAPFTVQINPYVSPYIPGPIDPIGPAPPVEPIVSFEYDEKYQSIQVGKNWAYDLNNLDDYEILDVGSASSIIDIDEERGYLSIAVNATSELDIGLYSIKFFKRDTNDQMRVFLKITLEILAIEETLSEEDIDETLSEEALELSIAAGIRYERLISEKIAQSLLEKQLQAEKTGIKLPDLPNVKFQPSSLTKMKEGIIVIQFSNEMRVFDALKTLNSNQQVVQIDSSSVRMLQNNDDEVFLLKNDFLKVEVIPGDESFNEIKDLQMSWQINDYTSSQMELQLNFTVPQDVSNKGGYDLIQIRFESTLLFVDQDGQALEQGTMIQREIPKQTEGSLQEIANQAEQAYQTASILLQILNILQGTSLQYLWDLVNSQQLVILFPLFRVEIPESTMIIFGALMTVAAFELIPTDVIYEASFNSNPDDAKPLNQDFADLGFEHHLFMQNFGTLGFFFFSLIPLYLFDCLVSKFKHIKCCRRFGKRLERKLYWSIVLRTVIESFIIGLICFEINIKFLDLSHDDHWTYFNSILTLVVGPIYILFPFVSAIFLYRNWSQLRRMEVVYGELYHGFNIESKTMLVWWLSNFVRSMLLVTAAVLFNKHFWLQMSILFNTSIFLIMIGGHINARKNKYDRNMDLFNEIKLIFIMYHMMLFTMFVSDVDLRVKIGYSCSFLVVFGLLVNMAKLIVTPFKVCVKKCRIRSAKRKSQKVSEKKRHLFQAKKFGERRFEERQRKLDRVRDLLSDFAQMRRQDSQALRQIRDEQVRLQLEFERRNEILQAQQSVKKENEPETFMINTCEVQPQQNKQVQGDHDKEQQQQAVVDQPLQTYDQHDDIIQIADKDPGQANKDETRELRDRILGNRRGLITDKLDMRHSMEEANDRRIRNPHVPVKKVTWDDLEYFWHQYGIGIAEIEKVAGYENFEVTDVIESNVFEEIHEQSIEEEFQDLNEAAAESEDEDYNRARIQYIKDNFPRHSKPLYHNGVAENTKPSLDSKGVAQYEKQGLPASNDDSKPNIFSNQVILQGDVRRRGKVHPLDFSAKDANFDFQDDFAHEKTTQDHQSKDSSMFNDQTPSKISSDEIIRFPGFQQNTRINRLIKKYSSNDSSSAPSKAEVDDLIKKYTKDSPAGTSPTTPFFKKVNLLNRKNTTSDSIRAIEKKE